MSRTKNLWINGISGRVGQELQELCRARSEFRCIGGMSHEGLVDKDGKVSPYSKKALSSLVAEAEVILDFSAPEANKLLLEGLAARPKTTALSIVIGTTGLSDAQKKAWQALTSTHKKIKLLIAPNTSLGVLVCSQVAKVLTRLLVPRGFDAEIVETHHRHKKDAPSGTALLLAESVVSANKKLGLKITTDREGQRQQQEVGVSAVRGGGVFGEHDIRFLGDHEEVTLSHRAFSRTLFAQGALVLATWLDSKAAGTYQFDDVEL